jgi:NAD(P)-dependent dehydrogenase (short-subunit alcohol dehydrogenase family)
LAKELSRYNIRVNEVIPGLLSKGVGELVPEKERAEYLRYCAAGRPGEPEEVAEAVAFLASEKAQYINAQRIFVDGGI